MISTNNNDNLQKCGTIFHVFFSSNEIYLSAIVSIVSWTKFIAKYLAHHCLQCQEKPNSISKVSERLNLNFYNFEISANKFNMQL